MAGSKTLGKRRKVMSMIPGDMTVSSNAFAEINELLGERLSELTQAQKKSLYTAMKRKYNNGVDIGYLKAVIFPDLFSADIPQPLTNLSYCRFTDKQECVVNTGTTGNQGTGQGVLLWYPRVTQGPCLFFYLCDTATQNVLPDTTPIPLATGNKVDPLKWRLGFSKSYADNFQAGVLVAGCISVQYTGQLDSESGIMVGGQLYGQGINNFVIEDIEHSQYVTTAKPGEGLRFVYLPADAPDYEFAPVGYGNSHNAGAHPTGNEQTFIIDTTSTSYKTASGGTQTFSSGDVTAKQLLYSNNTNFVAIYWKGLPAGQDWLRIEMTRRFNGVPKLQNRDIMEVTRPKKSYDARKSFDVLRQLCTNSPVGGHTLKELDSSQGALLESIPELGAVDLSSFTGAETLQDLAASIQPGNLERKGLVGEAPLGGNKRIYNTLF